VLIPIQCEYYALEGLTQLVATINLIRERLNPGLEIKGVVMTMYDARTNLSHDVTAEVRRHLDGSVFDTIIPRSVRLSEAPSFGLPIALYRAESKGAQAYAALAAELRARNSSGGIPILATGPTGQRDPAVARVAAVHVAAGHVPEPLPRPVRVPHVARAMGDS